MKLLTWNILHGGGPRRTPEIALALLALDADLVVLTEFRRTLGGQLAGVLYDHGWRHQLSTNPPEKSNGILLASRRPIEPGPPAPAPAMSQRWLEARLPGPADDAALRVTAVHIPDASFAGPSAQAAKADFWRRLVARARVTRAQPSVIVGDFNTGRHLLDESQQTFTCTALLGELATLGYRDAYRLCHPRGRDRSWFSHAGAGFRIDHTYVSPPLAPRVEDVWYGHDQRERGLSDHAPMLVKLAPAPVR